MEGFDDEAEAEEGGCGVVELESGAAITEMER